MSAFHSSASKTSSLKKPIINSRNSKLSSNSSYAGNDLSESGRLVVSSSDFIIGFFSDDVLDAEEWNALINYGYSEDDIEEMLAAKKDADMQKRDAERVTNVGMIMSTAEADGIPETRPSYLPLPLTPYFEFNAYCYYYNIDRTDYVVAAIGMETDTSIDRGDFTTVLDSTSFYTLVDDISGVPDSDCPLGTDEDPLDCSEQIVYCQSR